MSFEVIEKEVEANLLKEIESERKFMTFNKLVKILKLNALLSR